MLYLLLAPLRDEFGLLNVLRYPLFRAAVSFLVAWLVCLLFGPRYIRWLKRQKFGQEIRDDGPETHFSKKGTPTMGGLLMLAGLGAAVLLFADLRNHYVLSVTALTATFGFVGFFDDWAKIKQKGTKGIPGKLRLAVEFAASFVVLAILIYRFDFSTELSLPFVKESLFRVDLGWLYLLFGALVIVGTANAANLTDGLDGLVIGPVIASSATFTVLAYGAGVAIGGFNIAEYLKIPHLPGAEELIVVTAAMAGAGVGFLWYNCYPAEFFMGDVGSLALGGALGTLAVVTKNEFLSVIIHGVFVVEALSVMIQTGWFKYTRKKYGAGRRVFLMAPLHHHFEKLGWPETKVVVRFWIVSVLLAVGGLATLKLR